MQVFDFHEEIKLRGLLLPANLFRKKLNLGSFLHSKGYIHLMRLVTLMKQFTVFASKFPINVLLCCSTAVLLVACGGNVDADGTHQLAATAADVTTDAGPAAAASTAVPTPAVEAVAEAASSASAEAAPAAVADAAPVVIAEAAPTASTAGTTGQAAEVTTHAFELTGYGSTTLQAQAGQQDTGANAPAPIKQ